MKKNFYIFTALFAIATMTIGFTGCGNKKPPTKEFYVDGVVVDFQMTPGELRAANEDATIIKHIVPSAGKNDYSATVSTDGYEYYVINNNIAVTFDDNQVNQFITWNPNYKTPTGVHVGSTWGEVEKKYPNIEFSLTYYSYNYIAQRYEVAIEAYDPNSCTYFTFYHSEFSSVQWESLISITGGTDSWSTIYTSELSAYMLQSIQSSVTVSQIIVYDCEEDEEVGKVSGANTAEEAVRQMLTACINGDAATARSFMTKEVYNALYDDPSSVSASEREMALLAIQSASAQTFKIDDEVVMVRLQGWNRYKAFDLYMRYEYDGWVCFYYEYNR